LLSSDGILKKGIPTLGVIYIPAMDLLYYAQKDFGAFLNDKPICNTSNRESYVATNLIFHSSKETQDF